MKRYLITAGFVLLYTIIFAQHKHKNHKRIKDGIFLNFSQVKNNNPVPKIQIRTQINYSDINFFDELVKEKKITYYDKLGNSQEIKPSQIWGYCNKGILYINLHNSFNRIQILGSLSHFSALYTYQDDFMDYANPYQMTYDHIRPTQTELRQYILDFETGEVYPFDYNSMEILLQKDEELSTEYAKLPKRKKRNLIFLYLRKYNEKYVF